jgi:hypothetical protein
MFGFNFNHLNEKIMKKLFLIFVSMNFVILTNSCQKKELTEGIQQQKNSGEFSNQISTFSTVDNQHDIALNSAVDILQRALNGEFTFFGSKAIEVSTSVATLAVELANGSTNQIYIDTYVAAVKEIVTNPVNQLIVTGNHNHREANGVYFGMALGWNTPLIKGKFSSAEQNRILLTMKAALVACAYVMADHTSTGVQRPNKRIDMKGDVLYNAPNYTEGYGGSFLAATAVIGKNNIYSFLNNYEHGTFTTELASAGLTRISKIFLTTFSTSANGITYDASTAAKKETLVKNYVRYIDNNEAVSKFFFKGVSLTSIVADPVNLIAQLNSDCFSKIAREGEYAGSTGMATEFETADANGVRDALYYSATGVFNDVYNRYLVEKYGYWAASSQSSVKATIDLNLKVGLSDINSKAWNGYLTYKLGQHYYTRLVPYTTGMSWWQRVHDLTHTMGLAKEYYMNDSFDDSNYTAYPVWSATDGNWTFAAISSFTGYMPTTTTIKDTVIKTNVSDLRSRLISDFSESNYDITVQFKVNTFGTNAQIGIIGRYVDANNFYIMKYNNASSNFTIIEVKNNVWTTLKTSASTTLNTGTVYFLRASFNGNTLKFYVNNDEKASITNNSFTSGKLGLFTSYTDAYFDDVYVNKATLN